MAVWTRETESLSPDVERVTLYQDGVRLGFAEIIELWRTDKGFQAFWLDTLREVPFEAYCWECPPLTETELDRPFECVFLDNPALAATGADPTPFDEHFRAEPDAAVVTFDNLGGDARLAAPCPRADTDDAAYSHLAVFARQAPQDQAMALWPAVAEAVTARLGPQPLWLSTAGLGVYWLHVRLDSKPKYYRHRPYRAF